MLHTHFPFLHTTHASAIRPNPTGETIDGLHNRNAYALHRIITALDVDPANPRALLLCTHAASMICIGRALTGDMPADPNTDDFRCGTCSMSKFVRRRPALENPTEDIAEWDANRPGDVPLVDWRSGRGVMGGWNCVLNGDCSFLENGEERSWLVDALPSLPRPFTSCTILQLCTPYPRTTVVTCASSDIRRARASKGRLQKLNEDCAVLFYISSRLGDHRLAAGTFPATRAFSTYHCGRTAMLNYRLQEPDKRTRGIGNSVHRSLGFGYEY